MPEEFKMPYSQARKSRKKQGLLKNLLIYLMDRRVYKDDDKPSSPSPEPMLISPETSLEMTNIVVEVMSLGIDVKDIKTSESSSVGITGTVSYKMISIMNPSMMEKITDAISNSVENHLRVIIAKYTLAKLIQSANQMCDHLKQLCASDVSTIGVEIISLTMEFVSNESNIDMKAKEKFYDIASASYVSTKAADISKVSCNDYIRSEKQYENLTQLFALRLCNLEEMQKIVAQKLIDEILFESSLGKLSLDSIYNMRQLFSKREKKPYKSKADFSVSNYDVVVSNAMVSNLLSLQESQKTFAEAAIKMIFYEAECGNLDDSIDLWCKRYLMSSTLD